MMEIYSKSTQAKGLRFDSPVKTFFPDLKKSAREFNFTKVVGLVKLLIESWIYYNW